MAAASPAQGGHSAQHTMFLCHSPIFTSYSLHQAGSASPVSRLNLLEKTPRKDREINVSAIVFQVE